MVTFNVKFKFSEISPTTTIMDPIVSDDWETQLNTRKKKFVSYRPLIKTCTAEQLKDDSILRDGFNKPIYCPSGLFNIHLPGNLDIDTLTKLIGSDEPVRVIDVASQSEMPSKWTMGRWANYWKNPNRKRILNIISLEFSHTFLRKYIEAPKIVQRIDFVHTLWPKEEGSYCPFVPEAGQAPEMPTRARVSGTDESTRLTYPKVQYYLLMGVEGSFTDFHIDFGGSSVWYHVLQGQKDFLFIRPTPQNLKLYEKWTSSENQDTVFFSDIAEGPCYIMSLTAGDTMFIPPGWIHAVYTPVDTFVVGGNYLHPFGIDLQISVFGIEERTAVPLNSRFPFFVQLHWYYLDHYIHLSHNSNTPPRPLPDWERKGLIALGDFLPFYSYLSPVDHPDYLLEAVSRLLKDEPVPSLDQFLAEPTRKLYCLCRQPDSLLRADWIGCDYCSDWYHCGCVGLTLEDRDRLEMFYCPSCVEKGLVPAQMVGTRKRVTGEIKGEVGGGRKGEREAKRSKREKTETNGRSSRKQLEETPPISSEMIEPSIQSSVVKKFDISSPKNGSLRGVKERTLVTTY